VVDNSIENIHSLLPPMPLFLNSRYSNLENGVSIKKKSKELIIDDGVVSQEHEIFNSFPISDESFITSKVWL